MDYYKYKLTYQTINKINNMTECLNKKSYIV